MNQSINQYINQSIDLRQIYCQKKFKRQLPRVLRPVELHICWWHRSLRWASPIQSVREKIHLWNYHDWWYKNGIRTQAELKIHPDKCNEYSTCIFDFWTLKNIFFHFFIFFFEKKFFKCRFHINTTFLICYVCFGTCFTVCLFSATVIFSFDHYYKKFLINVRSSPKFLGKFFGQTKKLPKAKVHVKVHSLQFWGLPGCKKIPQSPKRTFLQRPIVMSIHPNAAPSTCAGSVSDKMPLSIAPRTQKRCVSEIGKGAAGERTDRWTSGRRPTPGRISVLNYPYGIFLFRFLPLKGRTKYIPKSLPGNPCEIETLIERHARWNPIFHIDVVSRKHPVKDLWQFQI